MNTVYKKGSATDRIAEHRQSQSLELLARRASMSRRKSRIWTQEEVDFMTAKAAVMFNGMATVIQLDPSPSE
jgi:hypothetical protein